MIPRVYKFNLRKKPDFFKLAQRKYSQYFTVFYQDIDENKGKIAVVIPKKTIKLRVKRNTYQRRIYSLALPYLKAGVKKNLVLVAKKELLSSDLKSLTQDIGKIFTKSIT